MRKLQQLLAEVGQRLERTQLNTLYTGSDATKPALLQDSFRHPIIYRAAYDVGGATAAPEKVWVESASRDAILEKAKEMAANPASNVLDFVSQHTRTHEQALLAAPTMLIQMPLARAAIQAYRKGFGALKCCKAVDLRCSSVTGGWV